MLNPGTVTFLNPWTCGIYKDGKARYKVDPATGQRTTDIDNELLEQVDAHLKGISPPGMVEVPIDRVFERQVLVPTYFDDRHNDGLRRFLDVNEIEGITVGELIDDQVIIERRGHGSPSNDQRTGQIPYVKVSDIRGLRININPTNLVSEPIAKRHWRGTNSGLQAWDLITPNRASSNIGEFAMLLPGEERVVLTKEVFVFRSSDQDVYDAFYLLWAFSLMAVRNQWKRITLMQTNREDCGTRYREILLPKAPSEAWAKQRSQPFRTYFTSIAQAKTEFTEALGGDQFQYTANVTSSASKADPGFMTREDPVSPTEWAWLPETVIPA